jgi:hypothetical protein
VDGVKDHYLRKLRKYLVVKTFFKNRFRKPTEKRRGDREKICDPAGLDFLSRMPGLAPPSVTHFFQCDYCFPRRSFYSSLF